MWFRSYSNWLLKECSAFLVPTITNIVNLSFSSGNSQHTLNEFVTSPQETYLGQRWTLWLPSNFQPSFYITNNKTCLKSRLSDHLTSNNLVNPHQSAYCKHHPTETAVLYIHDNLINAIGSDKICLCLLELSAAFDIIEHNVLLTRLSSWFGIHNTALNWSRSYFSCRCFRLKCNNDFSSTHTCLCGIPQGSVLAPLLFVTYTTPLNTLLLSLSLNNHPYAYDTQLWWIFLSFRPLDFHSNII